jgi:hypothetical protein
MEEEILRPSIEVNGASLTTGYDGGAYAYGLFGGLNLPSSVTYTLTDAYGTALVTAGTATLTTLTAALTTASVVGDQTLHFTQTVAMENFVNRTVAIVSSVNAAPVELRRVINQTGATTTALLYLDRPLEYAHAITTSSVRSITAAVPVAASAVSTGYRDAVLTLAWVYTISAGVTQTGMHTRSLLDFVRSPLINPASTNDLLDAYMGYSDQYSPSRMRSESWDRALLAAWEQDVVPRLLGIGLLPSSIVSLNDLIPATVEWAVWRLAHSGYLPYPAQDPEAWTDTQKGHAKEVLDIALANLRWYDENDDGSQGDAEVDRTYGVVTLYR